MAKLMLNKHPQKREIDGQVSKVALQKQIRELQESQHAAHEKIPLERVQTLPKFQEIFPINPLVRDAIAQNMKSLGFDAHHPLLLWKERNILIDGHTRLQAAKICALSHVFVSYLSFDNEEQALEYIFSLQFNRRNLSQADRLRFLIKWLESHGHKKLSSGHKKDIIAQRMNISSRSAQKYLNIASSGNLSIIEKVLEGELSINQGDVLLSQLRHISSSRVVSQVKKPSPKKPHHTRINHYFTHIKNHSKDQALLLINNSEELIYSLGESGLLSKVAIKELLKKISDVKNHLA